MVPNNVSLHCPFCGRHTAASHPEMTTYSPHMRRIAVGAPMEIALSDVAPYPAWYAHTEGNWWLAKCNACQMPLLVLNDADRVIPPAQPGPVDPSIPEPMSSDLREAKSCLAVGAANAAAVMARRAMQNTAVAQGAPPRKKLHDQISWLLQERKITAAQNELAQAVRWIGNHGAHDEEAPTNEDALVRTDVTLHDAEQAVEFVEDLCDALYRLASLARRQLAERNKKP